MTRVLIVEDEAHLAAGLKFNLEAEGYAAEVAPDGPAALSRLTGAGPEIDLVLLDVMLPGFDGFEVLRRLREAGRFVPVMMLTARGQAGDVLRGFELGADDYVPKPFDLAILLARVQSLLRRQAWLGRDQGTDAAEPGERCFGRNRVDLSAQTLERDGVQQSLTLMETSFLRYLLDNEGRTISRATLLEEVWGVRKDTDTRAVDNFVARLRRHIEDEPGRPRHLITVRGVGYRFLAEPDGPGA